MLLPVVLAAGGDAGVFTCLVLCLTWGCSASLLLSESELLLLESEDDVLDEPLLESAPSVVPEPAQLTWTE
jgi:hypothetical protein